MTKTIKINGTEHPISFSQSFPYHFEKMTGKKYLVELRGLSMDFAAIGDQSKELAQAAAENVSIVRVTELLHAALSNGYREAGRAFEITEYDVAAWLGQDMTLMPAFITALFDSLPKPKTDGEEKKVEAPTQSTGRS